MDTGSTSGAGMQSVAQTQSEEDDMVYNDACGPPRLALWAGLILDEPDLTVR